MYQGTIITKKRKTAMKKLKSARQPIGKANSADRILVERVQTGMRLEKRLLKILKALADYHDITLGDLIEGIVLHAFDGKLPFGEESRKRIVQLKDLYDFRLGAEASHRLFERQPEVSGSREK
jgi:hypothetical protein